MKKLCLNGHKISNADQKALDHYLLTTAKEWAQAALNGMVNKSVKTIYRDWIEIYKSKHEEIPGDISQIIMGILEMPEFKPYNRVVEEPDREKPQRDDAREDEIWEGGFDVEDYQDAALRAFYKDPEESLYDYMENKIAKRKKAFIRDCEPVLLNEGKPIASRHDKFIKDFTKRQDYKNRRQRDEAEGINF